MKKTTALVENSSKTVYETDKAGTWIQAYIDEIPGSGSKKQKIKGRAEANTVIAGTIFQFLNSYHVPTHFIKQVTGKELSIRQTEPIPIQVQVWNIASGSLSSRFDVAGGSDLPNPILEFYLVDEKKRDRQINDYHAQALGIATQDEMRGLTRLAMKINAVLKSFFSRRGLILADFMLEFGRLKGNVALTGDLTPETIQLLDRDTRKPVGPGAVGENIKDAAQLYAEITSRIVED